MPKYKILIGLDKPLFNLSPEEKELLESSKYCQAPEFRSSFKVRIC